MLWECPSISNKFITSWKLLNFAKPLKYWATFATLLVTQLYWNIRVLTHHKLWAACWIMFDKFIFVNLCIMYCALIKPPYDCEWCLSMYTSQSIAGIILIHVFMLIVFNIYQCLWLISDTYTKRYLYIWNMSSCTKDDVNEIRYVQ